MLTRMLDLCRDVPGLPILVCKRWLRCLPPDKCRIGSVMPLGRLSDALRSQSMRDVEVNGGIRQLQWNQLLPRAPDWPHLEWLTLRNMIVTSLVPPGTGSRLCALDIHSVRLESAEAMHTALAAATALKFLRCVAQRENDVPAIEALAACPALRRLELTIQNQDPVVDENLNVRATAYSWTPLLTLTQLTALTFLPRNGCTLTEPASVRIRSCPPPIV